MLTLRKSQDRGFANHGWLKTHHSFSFAGYYDPLHMGWGNLRVINEDYIAPGMGFGTHGHRNMEIVTYVISGALAHKDSMGNGTTIPAGEIQRMSAGKGITHSEFNPDDQHVTHLLQIWIEPDLPGINPSYEQQTINPERKHNALALIAVPASDTEAQDAVCIHADARIYAGNFHDGHGASLSLNPGRKAYVQLIRGQVTVNGQVLSPGDAAKLADETLLTLSNGQAAEVLVFDLAA